MGQWLGGVAYALAYLLLPVLLFLQRRRLRPDTSVARVGATVVAVLAVPSGWAGTRFVSDELLDAADVLGSAGAAVIYLVPVLAFAAFAALPRLLPNEAWPLLPLAALAPIAFAFFGITPWSTSGFDWAPILGGTGLLALAALAAPAVAASLQPVRFPHALAALVPLVVLVLILPFSAVAVLSGLTDGGGPGHAEHAWSAEFAPQGEGEYTLRVPFLYTEDALRAETLQRMRDALRVEGSATARFVGNGSIIEVRGEGPVRLEAVHGFFGDTGAREAFHGYRVADVPVRLDSDGVESGRLTWSADFSGGSGHTCWARAQITVEVSAGEPQPLPRDDGLREDGRVQAICA